MIYGLYLFLAFMVSLLITPLVGSIAHKIRVVDIPRGRHRHQNIVPKLGGVAIFISAFVIGIFFLEINWDIIQITLIAFVFLMIGALDDAFDISPWSKLLGQLAAATIFVWGGLSISEFSNPLTGAIISLGEYATIVSVLWIVSMINIVNITDGVDGLVSGIVGISASIIGVVNYSNGTYEIAKLSLIVAGAAFGFLIYNFFPAKIFLGDSGTMFLGFILAILGYLGGAKIATALLVLAIPILDGGFTIFLRIIKRKPIHMGDRMHLHFRLLDSGWSTVRVVFLYYFVTLIVGTLALFISGSYKLLALIVLFVVFLAGSILFIRSEKRK